VKASGTRTAFVLIGVVAIAAAFGYYVSSRPMDFRVYHFGARGVFDGTRPVYGPNSGLGWPMHYRYPPLFLLLFAPFAALPIGFAAALWVAGKVGVLIAVLAAFWKRGLKPATTYATAVGGLFIAPYIIEDFRYGNAQFFVVALTIAALLLVRERPLTAAASLALAISIKIWPAFFLPYLLVRRDWKPVVWTLVFVILLALVPTVYFGWSGNFNLLAQWYRQESQTQLGETEIWFPNQSLRGVLMRYLTVIDYSQVPDSNYPQINIAALDPLIVRSIWMILAAGIYALLLFLANRRRTTDGWLDHGLAFSLLPLLEPFTQKYALVALLWPALIIPSLMKRPAIRTLLYCATALVVIQPLAQGAGTQRLLQVLGVDFAATTILAVAFCIACVDERQTS
jgi:glycosyl transferase family 87